MPVPDPEDGPSNSVFEASVSAGVLRLRRPGTRWLSTGHPGGRVDAPAAYNVTVPADWDETDVVGYGRERRDRAGFDEPGPVLLTGVDQDHARRATLDGVEAVATAGVSNPATLAMPGDDRARASSAAGSGADAHAPPGTVNVFVGTDRSLDDGGLAGLMSAAAEARTATLLARTGYTGTTTDALVAGCDPAGPEAPFVGSATPVGRATRLCVRDAVLASLDARYADEDLPGSVAEADHGVAVDGEPTVSRLE